MDNLFLIVALAFIIVMMYVNGRKRKKAAAELQDGMKVGSTVLLHSGIVGAITSIEDTKIVVETTPGTKLTVLKAAVRSIEAAAKPAAKTAVASAKPVVKATPAAKPATSAKPAAAKPAAAAKTATAAKPTAKKPAAKPATSAKPAAAKSTTAKPAAKKPAAKPAK